MATPTSGSGGSAGLLSAYAATAAPGAGASLASVTVPEPGWYDVEVYAWNSGSAAGALGTDDLNIGLYSDPVTADTMVLQRIVPWNPFILAATTPIVRVRARVYAQTTIEVEAIAAATASTKYAVALSVEPPGGSGNIDPAVI